MPYTIYHIREVMAYCSLNICTCRRIEKRPLSRLLNLPRVDKSWGLRYCAFDMSLISDFLTASAKLLCTFFCATVGNRLPSTKQTLSLRLGLGLGLGLELELQLELRLSHVKCIKLVLRFSLVWRAEVCGLEKKNWFE